MLGGISLGTDPITVATPDMTNLQPFSIDAYDADPPQDFTVGQFFDADGTHDGSDAAQLSATIDWGDGSAPTAATLTLQPGAGPTTSRSTTSTAPTTTPRPAPTRPGSPSR